ncbi:hypothetical protein CVT25_013499 [Psilocybe cyanescens]|uniref:Small ribosomal subunit protein uS7 domain-containing protein n=1 Tax=Psilocybe cyanescens TaxID=93625 RepID=A0A409XSU8_PSICY|nr:hypothetical protein CVT25_013499 [Psilocybe cyanescens]
MTFDAIDEGESSSEPPIARDGQLYACSVLQAHQGTLHLVLDERRDTFMESIGSSVGDVLALKSPLQLPNQLKGSGITITSPKPSATYPLVCQSHISLTLCGEIITYDLESMPSNPRIVIELLKATKSERGNYMITGAFYRRMGHPGSAKAVLMSMLEEFSTRRVDFESLHPAFLLLSGCELDLAKLDKAAKKDASEHYSAVQTWLQKVFGKAKPDKTTTDQIENRQGSLRNFPDNQGCTCSREGASKLSSTDINGMEREIQSLKDRHSNQQSRMSSLRSSKRKLEDDFFYERDMRRKYQRRLDDLEKERDTARKMEAYALEQVKMEVLARKMAEERGGREWSTSFLVESDCTVKTETAEASNLDFVCTQQVQTLARELGSEVKLFGKWDTQDVEVKDISLTDYIQVRHAVYLPHTAGRYAKKQFKKAQMPIVERLVDSLMMKGRNNGKKLLAVRIVAHAFEIIHLLTDQNPIQVLVDAIVNTGPREDSTRIGSQGTVRRQAVDVSPLRRVNQSISLITTGTRESAFRNVKSIAECLADELINAAKGSSNSYAIKKKDELERVAKSNR